MRRIAVALFVVLWITAMSLYPGGSAFDPDAVGHVWWRNFVCDLLASETSDGRSNRAGSIAMTTGVVVVVLFGMLRLWWSVRVGMRWRTVVRVVAIGAVLLTLGICVEQAMALPLPHGVLVMAAGVVGLVPTALAMRDDWQQPDDSFVRRGAMVGLGLSAIVNFVSYTIVQLGGPLTPVVPTAQKCAILFLLLWLWLIPDRAPEQVH